MRRATVLFVVIVSAALALVGIAAADVESNNLPGGTAISVEIATPLDGAVFQLGDPVPISGAASVATGVTIKDTTVVFVIDRSGSMGADAGVDCDGAPGNETRLECEKAAVIEAINAAADPGSAVDLVGVVAFESGSSQLYFGAPDASAVAAVNGIGLGGQTCYSCGLEDATAYLNSIGNTNPNNLVIFLSDGANNVGADIDPPYSPTPAFPSGTVVHAIAMGAGVSCATNPPLGGFQDVVALGAAGSACHQTTNFAEVADLIADAIGSELTSVTLYVDGIPVLSVPGLPLPGPISVPFAYVAGGLAAGPHTITATANGTDALGAGSVSDTHAILVNAPPSCAGVAPSLTELWPPNGAMTTITLGGATDPEGGAVAITITGVRQDEVVAGPGNNREPDAADMSGDSVDLRAERFGGEDGRVYTISYTATDPLGGQCSGSVTVSVPHSQNGTAAVDQGPLYDSFTP